MLFALSAYTVSKSRITEHIYQHYSGTFKLIGEGVARHSGQEREQWLSAIERLSGLSFEAQYFADKQLPDKQLRKLLKDKFLFVVDKELVTSKAYILLPDEQSYLSVQVDDYGTSLVRISAFLMLNELGRHRSEARLEALNRLKELYSYPIELVAMSDLAISASNLRTIKKGDVAVVLNISGATTSNMMAYAPIGNSRFVLKLGMIPLFDWLPLSHLIAAIAFTLVAMATAVFYLVKPIERRLAEVDDKIVAIAQDKEMITTDNAPSDAITKLSNTVDSMALRIQRLLAAQTDMVRAISHELRAPITRVRFQLVMLQEAKQPNQHAQGIEKNLDELEKLIDEVLTFLKLKSHQPELTFEAIDATQLIKQLIKTHAPAHSNIHIDMAINSHQPMLADQHYIFRAAGNLLLNALKYAKARIEIGYQKDADSFILWVADDGPGIPEEQRIDIFTPFKRLDASRARQSGGYGLGLSIVQQIAHWHQGTISVVDSNYGGTLFSIRWPITEVSNAHC
ncbi:two-component sensor histidine kinase [Pseudoalteromonas sp. A25]|nr:two-component sensor histidine kinase [Pseudoalteromonas sp. A25]